MVFTAPAIHYSALTTMPPLLTPTKSHHSIKSSATVRLKLNQLFKKRLNNDINNQHIINNDINNTMKLPVSDSHKTKIIEQDRFHSKLMNDNDLNNHDEPIDSEKKLLLKY